MANWKPRGYNVLSPYLLTSQSERLLKFLEKVMGGKRRHVYQDEDGRMIHAEVKIGDSILMMGDPGDGSSDHCHIHVYVPNAKTTYAKAMKAGAKSVRKVEQKDDADQRGGFTDPTGSVTIWVGTRVGVEKKKR